MWNKSIFGLVGNKIENLVEKKEIGASAKMKKSANALKKIAIAKLKVCTKANCSKIVFLY